jgi:hypothetical protein
MVWQNLPRAIEEFALPTINYYDCPRDNVSMNHIHTGPPPPRLNTSRNPL